MRIDSVDSIRLLAIVAVIAIHTTPFSQNPGEFNRLYYYLHISIDQTARFAVPFFFVISGYFFGIKIFAGAGPIETARKMLLRIVILYLSWCLIYFMPYNLSAISEYGLSGPLKESWWSINNAIENPAMFLLQGSKVHLWFLVSLMMCIAVTAIFLNRRLTKSLIVISIALYVFGVLAKSYSATESGIEINFNTRNGPFFGMALFVTGYILANRKTTTNWFYYGLLTFTIGCLLHFSEIFYLLKIHNISPIQDFVFGTYLMGVGAAVASLSNHKILCNKWAAKTGKLTLGIYASHLVFVDLLRPADQFLNHPVWEILFVALVLSLSVILTNLLSLSKLTRRLVE